MVSTKTCSSCEENSYHPSARRRTNITAYRCSLVSGAHRKRHHATLPFQGVGVSRNWFHLHPSSSLNLSTSPPVLHQLAPVPSPPESNEPRRARLASATVGDVVSSTTVSLLARFLWFVGPFGAPRLSLRPHIHGIQPGCLSSVKSPQPPSPSSPSNPVRGPSLSTLFFLLLLLSPPLPPPPTRRRGELPLRCRRHDPTQ